MRSELLVAVALLCVDVGCATPDTSGPETTETTTQAVTCNASPGSIASAARRTYAVSCVIRDHTTSANHYIYVGGTTAGNTVSDAIYDSTDAVSFSEVSGKVIHVARTNHRAVVMQDSNGKDWCTVYGGTTTVGSHVPSKAVDAIKVDNGVFTVVTGSDMQIARELPSVDVCAGKPIVFGGIASNGKGIKDVETANIAVPNGTETWTNQTNEMPYAAGNFAVVKIPGIDKYIASAGHNDSGASGAPQDTIWSMNATGGSSCTNIASVDVSSAPAVDIFMSNPVEGHVGFYKGNSGGAGVVDTVIFATGRKSTSASETNATEVTVDWSTPSNSTVSVASNVTQGHYRPSIVQTTIGGVTKHTIIYGANPADNAGVTDIDQFRIGTGWQTMCSTTDAHRGPFSWFDGTHIFTIGGTSAVVEKTTP